jgi:diguanylate cyclase (GGDEF)-like protein
MTDSQALLCALAQRWLSDLLPPSVRQDLAADFNEACQMLANDTRHAHWLKATRLFHHWDEVLEDPQPDPAVLDALRQALFDRSQVEIVYRNSGQSKTGRIHPFGWVRRNDVDYLACTFWDYDHPVWLAVHRVQSAQPLDVPTAPRATPESQASFLDAPPLPPTFDEPEMSVTLEFPAHLHEVIRERPPRGRGITIDPPADGYFRLSGIVPDSLGLHWWIRGFNDQVRIIEPPSLRRRLHGLLFDRLTGLVNRHEFDCMLPRRLAETRRTKQPLSAVLLDLDHFNQVNNCFGHPFGDTMLQHAADCVKRVCRTMDLPVRFGGEEIILLLPNTTCADALKIAERLRQALQEWPVPLTPAAIEQFEKLCQSQTTQLDLKLDDRGLTLTASLGVTCYEGNDSTKSRQTLDELEALGKELVDRADNALYEAKNTGRNKVSCCPYPQDDSVESTVANDPAPSPPRDRSHDRR